MVLQLTLNEGGSIASGGKERLSQPGPGELVQQKQRPGCYSPKLCVSKSKNTLSLSLSLSHSFFSLLVSYFSSHPPSYFLPSLMIPSGNPGTHLLIPAREAFPHPFITPTRWVKTLRGCPAVQVQVGSSSKAPSSTRPP